MKLLAKILYTKYTVAMLMKANTLGYIMDIRYYITPDVWLGYIEGRPHVFSMPANRVGVCHVIRGRTSKVVQYDVSRAVELPQEALSKLFGIMWGVHNAQRKEIDVRDLLGSIFPRFRRTVEWYLANTPATYHADLVQWVKDLPEGVLCKPIQYMPNMLSGDVPIQSSGYLGGLFEIAVQKKERQLEVTNIVEKRKRTNIIVAAILVMVIVMGGGAYMIISDGGGLEMIPGLSSIVPSIDRSTSSSADTVNADLCSAESVQANYIDATDAALAIYKGELDCDPDEIPGQIGFMVQSVYDPVLLEWMVNNEDIAGGGPVDAVTDGIERLAP